MDNFEKQMEELKTPNVNPDPPIELKLAIVNADRSATLGLWFIIAPYFFVGCMLLKYEINVNLGLLDTITNFFHRLDKNPATWWLQPVLLIGLPITGIILNILSITHFKWEKISSLLTVSVKLKWYNVLVLLATLAIIAVLLLYLIMENFQVHPGS